MTVWSRQAIDSISYYAVCRFVLFFVVASASFSGFYEKSHFHEAGVPGDWAPTSFEAIVNGTAEKPYIYRRLLPDVINWLDGAAPSGIKDWLYWRQKSGPEPYLQAIDVSPTARSKVYFFRYLLLYLITFLFAFLAVYSMYLVCKRLSLTEAAATVAPAIFIMLVPYFQSPGGYAYDYSELTFIALAVWMAMKFEWHWLIPVAILGTWNKESFLLFVPCLFPFIRQRASRSRSIVGTAVLMALCASIFDVMRLRFAQNAGTIVVVQWRDQLDFLMHPRDFLTLGDQTYGLRVPRIYSAFLLPLLIWTVWRGWRQLPDVVKQHAKIAATINFPLFALFCDPGEIRDLSFLYVTFLLILALNLNKWMNRTGTLSSPGEKRFVPDNSNREANRAGPAALSYCDQSAYVASSTLRGSGNWAG